MASLHPRRIPGRWRDGYALDYHTVSSEFLGHDEYGHPQFETTRSEIGELLFRLKYRSDTSVVSEIVDTAQTWFTTWKLRVELLVPVTPSRSRDIQLVLLLGKEIARRLNLRFVEAVQRVREVPQLKDVHSYDERSQLLQGSHHVDAKAVRSANILLFDDLYRSGATMNEITANLYDQGEAAAVYALAITRTRNG
jgi:competence protein ComFC